MLISNTSELKYVPDIVFKILETETGSSLIRLPNELGQTPLHCCAARNVNIQHKILYVLLEHDDEYNTAAYIQDNKGRTPLHLATLNHNSKGVEILLDFYPDCMEIVDNKGCNVVHLAANTGCLDTFREFLLRTPSCDRLINKKNNDGNTPLHLLAATTASLPSHSCFFWLSHFMFLYKRLLDVRAFNNNNLTPGDILASNRSLHHLDVSTRRGKVLPRGRRINRSNGKAESEERAETQSTQSDTEVNKNRLEKVEKRISVLKKSRETRLVVAALIATVSFTAGFTLPGGFDQNPGKNIGLALLSKKSAFIAFLISDTIAFTLSSLAVILCFALTTHNHLVRAERTSVLAQFLTSLSLGALMTAFVTGVYVVVSDSPRLAFTVIAICALYFYCYLHLLVRSFVSVAFYLTRNIRSRFSE